MGLFSFPFEELKKYVQDQYWKYYQSQKEVQKELHQEIRKLGNTIWKLQNRLSKAGRKLKAAQESNRQLKEENYFLRSKWENETVDTDE